MSLTFTRVRLWLLATNVFQVGLGLYLVLLGFQAVPIYGSQVSIALWGKPEVPPDALTLTRWLFAVLGSTIAGSALTRAYLVAIPLSRKEPWAWSCLLLSYLIWFIPDTAASLVLGVWPNAVFNLVPFLMEVPPLLLIRRHLTSTSRD